MKGQIRNELKTALFHGFLKKKRELQKVRRKKKVCKGNEPRTLLEIIGGG